MENNTEYRADPSPNTLLFIETSIKYLERLFTTELEAIRQTMAAEAKRVDSIRVVDVAAVAVASENTAKRAEVLATQLSISADTLRNLVSQTALTTAQQTAAVNDQVNERIALLEKVQYENQGKSSAPTALMVRLDALEKIQNQDTGSSKGKNQMWILITSGILFVISIASFLIPLFTTK